MYYYPRDWYIRSKINERIDIFKYHSVIFGT